MRTKSSLFVDWPLLLATFPIVAAGLVTMNSIGIGIDFFSKQVVWWMVSLFVFFVLLFLDYRFLRDSRIVTVLYGAILGILVLLFVVGSVFQGAQSWFNVGLFAIQPADPAKVILVIILAKYFSKRHVDIADIRHILVSGLYMALIALLVLLQPDFGSAVIIFAIWFGMVLISGISWKHLLGLIAVGAISFTLLWNFGFATYQKARIMNFLNPLADITGTGYNAYQSMIAVGSGQLVGKGVGYGSQSRLSFLPEYETDFIFAAFAEEWGFVGVTFIFICYLIVLWRLVKLASMGETNFETLFTAGVAIILFTHFIIHVGMNIGLLPITGTTVPFMSYGGSNLLTTYAMLGIVMGMGKYRRYSYGTSESYEIIPEKAEL